MADNTRLASMTGGDLVATDDIGSGVAAGAKAQRIKVGFGPDGAYSDVAPDTGLPVTGAVKELTGSASANNTDLITAGDVSTYRTFSLQLTGTFTATVAVQGSNDNSTWVTLPIVGMGTASPILAASASAANVYVGAVHTKYLRVRTTAYTSGTATATLELSAKANTPVSVYAYASSANPATVQGGNTVGDGFNPTNLIAAVAYAELYNGTSWERARTISIADGGSGTGVPGVASMAYDGQSGVYRKLRGDGLGSQYVRPFGTSSSTLANVTAATTSATVLASNATRAQAIIFNDSTANLYIKLSSGGAASTTSFSYKVAAGAHWELPTDGGVYTGQITGIWDAANGAARVTEIYN